jgi:hypothetical protein
VFKLRMFIATWMLLLVLGIAQADTIQSFNISGTYYTYLGAPQSFSGGLLSVDLTTNSIDSLNLVGVPDVSIFAGPPYSDLSSHLGGLVLDHGVNENIEASIYLFPAGNGFYSGGTLAASGFGPPGSVASQCPAHPALCDDAAVSFNALLTPDPTLTPLPATLPLFGTTFCAMALLWRRMRRKIALPA